MIVLTRSTLVTAGTCDGFFKVAEKVVAKVPSVQFVYWGPDRVKNHFYRLVGQAGLQNYVQYKNDSEDVFDIYRHARLFLSLAMNHDGDVRAVLKARSFSLPIVAFANETTSNLIINGVDGLLVDDGDFNSISSVIEQLLHQAERAQQYGCAGCHEDYLVTAFYE